MIRFISSAKLHFFFHICNFFSTFAPIFKIFTFKQSQQLNTLFHFLFAQYQLSTVRQLLPTTRFVFFASAIVFRGMLQSKNSHRYAKRVNSPSSLAIYTTEVVHQSNITHFCSKIPQHTVSAISKTAFVLLMKDIHFAKRYCLTSGIIFPFSKLAMKEVFNQQL